MKTDTHHFWIGIAVMVSTPRTYCRRVSAPVIQAQAKQTTAATRRMTLPSGMRSAAGSGSIRYAMTMCVLRRAISGIDRKIIGQSANDATSYAHVVGALKK